MEEDHDSGSRAKLFVKVRKPAFLVEGIFNLCAQSGHVGVLQLMHERCKLRE